MKVARLSSSYYDFSIYIHNVIEYKKTKRNAERKRKDLFFSLTGALLDFCFGRAALAVSVTSDWTKLYRHVWTLQLRGTPNSSTETEKNKKNDFLRTVDIYKMLKLGESNLFKMKWRPGAECWCMTPFSECVCVYIGVLWMYCVCVVLYCMCVSFTSCLKEGRGGHKRLHKSLFFLDSLILPPKRKQKQTPSCLIQGPRGNSLLLPLEMAIE